MKRISNTILLLLFFCLSAASQTLEDAKNFFASKQYEDALPILKKFVTQQPTNAKLCYWYGVSLLKTGDEKQAVKYLDMANKRKVVDAILPLAEAYRKTYQFDRATACLESYKAIALRRKEATGELDKQLQKCRKGADMMLGVENVCVIDSFVVDKNNFLSMYKLSKSSGKLYTFADFFQINDSCNSTVYEPERGYCIYYGAINDNHVNLYRKLKTTSGWSAPILLPTNINVQANVNYPFLMNDGITIYYASDGNESLGGYDIFITRYDTDNDSYLKPENVGMPFNSPYNDYMLAIDEYKNLGWFASDRYQPDGKVCIYIFIPNASKKIYDNKAIAPEKMRDLARLSSIANTWTDRQQDVDSAKVRLDELFNLQSTVVEKKKDFEFVIDDSHTYYLYSDFVSEAARQQFKAYNELKKSYLEIGDKLETARRQYANSNSSTRGKMSAGILDMEKRYMQLENEMEGQALKVRNLEINALKK
jgi:tetratricopeptide (TPR) repeat protein